MVPSFFISSVSECYKRALCCAIAYACLASCGGGGGNESAGGATTGAQELVVSPEEVKAPADAGATDAAAHANPSPAAERDVTVAAAPGKTCGIANFQQEVMDRVNAARANSRYCDQVFYPGAPQLSWNLKLFNAAAGHSADMANNDYFSHTSLDGRAFSQRITGAGYTWSVASENIAGGQNTIQQAIETWLKSPGHCANIMNAQFADVGVSCVANPSSKYKQYWTMKLAAPR